MFDGDVLVMYRRNTFREEDTDSDKVDERMNEWEQLMFERIDSRGQMMKLNKVELNHSIRYQDTLTNQIVYSFAEINISPLSYLTDQDLKLRANSLAHSQYKKEKREYARHVAKKKLFWIMSVVKAKLFANKLKKRVQMKRELRRQREQMELEQETLITSTMLHKDTFEPFNNQSNKSLKS